MTKNLRMLMIWQRAAAMWLAFTANQRTMCRFGMFPAEEMKAATDALSAELESPREVGKDLAVALMDCASKDGGMRA